jgi:G3E family GTPase
MKYVPEDERLNEGAHTRTLSRSLARAHALSLALSRAHTQLTLTHTHTLTRTRTLSHTLTCIDRYYMLIGFLIRVLREQVIRSKGFVWLATRPEVMGIWSSAGAAVQLSGGEPWW